ncbi:hypothetical protein [Rhodococcus sp. ARC_M5]|uniref:hypothetical protein n=1 Tax=Rhodococcus sp. ARC_M5 TaxID=2928851 RepID=UPI001FB51AC6|nr:hypothetical protein [Rhodococcus sp. ARC_M5]MCJ0893233.1 hypothetical protein [Rhodococcus sp. ARC_M5]
MARRTHDPLDGKIKRQRQRRAQNRGYSGTAREDRFDAKDARLVARRDEARRAIRRILVQQHGPDAVAPWPEGDDLGA